MGTDDRTESKEDMLIVVATEKEKEIAEKRYKGQEILVTGVGALNAIEKTKDLPRDTEIINFGYCGSNSLPKGTIVNIKETTILHETADYDTPTYTLDTEGMPCYTANDFVTRTNKTEPSVFDMELAYIAALGFTKLKSTKIVSDNLNYDEYEREVARDNASD